jgi:hypothetical protein
MSSRANRPIAPRAAATATTGLVAVVLLATAPAAGAQSPTGVVSFPSPGGRSASPRTEISFRGAHADGLGASFVPARQFRSGERVRVRVPAGVRVADGDGRIHEFTTARIVGGFATEGPSGAPRGRGPFAALRSAPGLAPPTIRSLVALPGRRAGLVFIAPKRGEGQGGPMIVDDAGRPVYFRPMGVGVRATDFRVQRYRGQPVLTWWQGRARGGSGRGEGMIVDAGYRTIARVRAANGFAADLHEFALTDRDTALVVAYAPVRRNLGAVNGPRDGVAVDGIAQEIELSTGRVRFEWHSLDHVALGDTDLPRPKSSRDPFDYFHINSFNADPAGGYVISARHVSSVLKIDDAGNVQWRLGGRSGTLRRGRGVRFNLQHDAVPRGDGVYTIFDNSAKGIRKASRAITVRVDPVARTATLLRSLSHPGDVLAATQGDQQLLEGGSVFVGWGSQGRASEFGPDGSLLFDLRLPRLYDTYRAYRFPWTGRPVVRPRVRGAAGPDGTTVYASWNGSTETASWTVLAGASPAALAPVTAAPRGGLETAIQVATTAPYVAVQANDVAGTPLNGSAAVRVRGRP